MTPPDDTSVYVDARPLVTRVARVGDCPPQVIVDRGATVTTVLPLNKTIETASPGPQGRPGPPGPAGGNVFQGKAAVALGGHRAVRGSADALSYASSDVEAHGDDVMGITLGAASVGGDVSVQASGEIHEPSWTWVPFEPIFLGFDGILTQTPPVFGFFSLMLGFATGTTSMMIRIEQPIYYNEV